MQRENRTGQSGTAQVGYSARKTRRCAALREPLGAPEVEVGGRPDRDDVGLGSREQVAPGVSRNVDGQPTVDDRLAVLVERGGVVDRDHLGPTRPGSLAREQRQDGQRRQVLLAFDRIVGRIVGHAVGEQPIDFVLDPLVDPHRGLRIERQRGPPHPEHPVDPGPQPDRALLLLQPRHSVVVEQLACLHLQVFLELVSGHRRGHVHQAVDLPGEYISPRRWHLPQRTGRRIDVGAGHVAGLHRGLEPWQLPQCATAFQHLLGRVHRDVRRVREDLLPVAGLRVERAPDLDVERIEPRPDAAGRRCSRHELVAVGDTGIAGGELGHERQHVHPDVHPAPSPDAIR